MDIEIYIKEQTDLVKNYLKQTFRIPIAELPGIDDFLNVFLKNILSLKVWVDNISKSNIIFRESIIYIEEIISNLNQALVLGIIGFKVPSCVMMRRSLENLISFIYYKDHPVEYFKKEFGIIQFTRFKDLQEYFRTYPAELVYGVINKKEFQHLLKYLVSKLNAVYKELSDYVHGSRKEYLELKKYIDSITPKEETLKHLIKMAKDVGDILNSTLIIFFFDTYCSFDKTIKSLMRLAINDDKIKQRIAKAFGNL